MKNFAPILLLLIILPAHSELPIETYGQLTLDTLPVHTVIVNSFNGRAQVYDADNQQMLGMLSTGIDTNAVEVDRGRGQMYAAETYLSRHTRGERTDVVTIYDIRTLSAVDEIVIPPKHAGGSPMRHYSGIIEDGDARFMLVTNITPAVSISVADLESKRFLTEIPTAGCGLVYPVSGLRFLQLCGDGSAQMITLDRAGSETDRVRSDTFFDLQADPLMEKPVRLADGWLFNTFNGRFFKVRAKGNSVSAEEQFEVDTPGWRIGGMQPLAFHAPSNLLLALVHEGGDNTHKDPGTEVWYMNPDSGDVLHRMTLERPTISIQVSQDDSPLIYAGTVVENKVDIYDLKSGQITGSVSSTGFPTILQNL